MNKTLSSVLAAIALGALAVGPVSAATAPAPKILAQAQASMVKGTIKDNSGAPIAGVSVALRGAQSYSAVTDANGAFAIASVAPGVYLITAQKAGFDTASESNLAVVAGENQALSIVMHRATLTSLQTIATVRSTGRGEFNTTPASVAVVTAQTFIDQAQPQVTRVLNQIPGVQINFPGASANGATAGSITFPIVRGAAGYETASLIDGHPVSVGSAGDFVTSFLSSYLFGDIEVVKGPGADSPVVNSAIGGSINFRTKDPTLTPTPTYIIGTDNHGGFYGTFGISDTVGRLGFVAQIATLSSPSAVNGKEVYFDPNFDFLPGATSAFDSLGSGDESLPVAGTSSTATQASSLLACCYPLSGYLNTNGELLKARYRFSGATTATVTYLGGQSYSDQNGNVGNITNYTFDPASQASNANGTYAGSLKQGQVIPVDYLFPGGINNETDNEPIFEGEVSTTVNNDTLLARYYHASIERIGFEGSTPGALHYDNVTLNGIDQYTGNVFNNFQTQLGVQDFFRQNQIDRLSGETLEYTHPFGERDDVTFSVDQTNQNSFFDSISPDYSQIGPSDPAITSVSDPQGSNQVFTTYMLRSHLYLGSKLGITLANYLNTYRNTFATACPFTSNGFSCAPDGSNATFQTTNATHDDPRIGLVYQPSQDLAIRLAAGSSIAPPYIDLLNQVPQGQVSYSTGSPYAYVTVPNANLRPETAFGYDLGADYRLRNGFAEISGDIYQTNLFNRYFRQSTLTNQFCTAALCPSTQGPVPATTQIVDQTVTNLSNVRFQGVELSIKRQPQTGFGFSLSGSLERAYAYNLPGNFYCSFVPTAATPCTPANYDQNLTVVANQNFTNGSDSYGGTSFVGATAVPYFQGDANISYTTKNGIYLLFGETAYGKNNSLNEPPFGLAYATVRVPLSKQLAVQVSGDNIFNAYPGVIPNFIGGVPISLANGQKAATTANVLGPATYRFQISQSLP